VLSVGQKKDKQKRKRGKIQSTWHKVAQQEFFWGKENGWLENSQRDEHAPGNISIDDLEGILPALSPKMCNFCAMSIGYFSIGLYCNSPFYFWPG